MKPSKLLSAVTSADILKVMNDTRDRLRVATEARDAAAAEFKAKQYDLIADGDEVGVERLRNAVKVAERAVEQQTVYLEAVRQRHERAIADEQTAGLATLRTEIDRLGREQYQAAHTIRLTVQELGKKIEAYQAGGEELKRKSDALLVATRERAGNDRSMPTAVSVSDYKPLFAAADQLHLIALDLYVCTSGRFPLRNVGLDLYTISQGPRFDERVRDYVSMLLRGLPGHSPQPPRAA